MEEQERKKRKALYGIRATSKIFESAAINSRIPWSGSKIMPTEEGSKEVTRSWKEKLIIDSESKTKAIFDVFVLLLVGYSCVTSVYNVAIRSTEQDKLMEAFDTVVEASFILDLLLNFIQSYKHPETYENIMDLKMIARNYVFKGWFFIDFIAVFPFEILFPTGQMTKLFRMFRLPRLIKLIDISRFNKLLKSLMSNSSRDEKIVAQYMMLYVYKILRLILIAMIITYFIGCFWYYLCNIGGDTELSADGEVVSDDFLNG